MLRMTLSSASETGMTLATLPLGETAILKAPRVQTPTGYRLLEMGLTEGAEVRVVRRAPAGGPLEIWVRGTRLTLREADASAFDVERAHKGEDKQTGERFRIAVVGNPNAGKTTLFNRLTGLNARVGNYPGITVEHREAEVGAGGRTLSLIDLPGTYSLVPRAEDEALTVRAILGLVEGTPRPDALLYVLDATAIERHLYFLLQLMELDIPIVVAVTMLDVIEEDGKSFEQALLADRLSLVVERAENVSAALPTIARKLADASLPRAAPLSSDRSEESKRLGFVSDESCERYLAEVATREATGLLWPQKEDASRNDDNTNVLDGAQRRYQQAATVAKDVIRAPGLLQRASKSDVITSQIDAVALHPRLGPLLLVVTFGVLFQALFSWAGPIMDSTSEIVGTIGGAFAALIPSSLPLLRSLWIDGVVAGVGNVVVFVPQIFILFFALGVLEDSGYLARAAFLLDRLMARVGLHGRAFVPLLSGFACAVPAVMAARTIESEKDRLVTILVTPLVSCSARLPVYSLIIGTLFATSPKVLGIVHPGTLLMFSMYALGLVAAIGMAALFKRSILKSRTPDLVMELPPYRLPRPASLLKHTLGRVRIFLVEAGTIILALTIVLWGLFNFPRDAVAEAKAKAEVARLEAVAAELGAPGAKATNRPTDAATAFVGSDDEEKNAASEAVRKIEEEIAAVKAKHAAARVENSLAGTMGKAIEPIVAPLGFDWKIGVGLVASFAAREVLVSSLGLVYGLGDGLDEESVDLRKAMRNETYPGTTRKVYTPLVGLSLMVFFVLAMQCMSTLAAVKRETGGWKWPVFQFAYMTALAYLSALVVYQVGRLLGFGG